MYKKGNRRTQREKNDDSNENSSTFFAAFGFGFLDLGYFGKRNKRGCFFFFIFYIGLPKMKVMAISLRDLAGASIKLGYHGDQRSIDWNDIIDSDPKKKKNN